MARWRRARGDVMSLRPLTHSAGRGAQLSLLSSLSCLPHAQVTVYNPNDNNFKLYSELRVDTKTANNRASGNTVLSSDV